MIEIFLIAVSLALDALAVSVANGLTVKNFGIKHALAMGGFFGAFQFIMPVLGWLLGNTVSSYVSKFSPYIAFALLAFVGVKMLIDGIKEEDSDESGTELTVNRLFVLAIATSIDALAVGVSFALTGDVNIWVASVIIGAVAFILSVMGGMLGKHFSGVFQKRATIIGGVVLICIGIKILVESFF